MKCELVEESYPGDGTTRIQVFGVGGGGCNAVNRMIEQGVQGVEFVAANTDLQSLEASAAPTKIALGRKQTRGLGAGGDPAIGRQSAEEDAETIRGLVQAVDMLFITAGMGGGTGTGAAAVIAQIARECGVLSVGVVTLPFHFEGRPKMKLAEAGVLELRQHVDTVITIPNQTLLEIVPDTPMMEAFTKADEILKMGVQGVADLITQSGYINVDFNDVKTVMADGGTALMGIGVANGDDRATKAATEALSNPLLSGFSIKGAQGVLVQLTGDEQFSLSECNTVMNQIHDQIHSDEVTVTYGMNVVPGFEGGLRVTVIATGFDPGSKEAAESREKKNGRKELPPDSLTIPAVEEDRPLVDVSEESLLMEPAFFRRPTRES